MHSNRAEGFLTRLNSESPRSRILLEAGFLEELLRTAILGRLADNKSARELFGGESSMGLGLLAKYAHALGLIGEHEIAALKKFSRARNKIAHSWSADFTDTELQKLASSIQLVSVKGDPEFSAHQRCFAKLDYLGVYLTEEFVNRFRRVSSIKHFEGTYLKAIRLNPETGEKLTETTHK